MKVIQEGSKLQISIDSTSRWTFPFHYDAGTECHASLVADVINRRFADTETYRL